MFENIQKSGSDTISIDFYNVIKVMEVGDFPGVKTTSGHIEWIAVTIKIFDVTGGGSFWVFSFFICNVVKFDEVCCCFINAAPFGWRFYVWSEGNNIVQGTAKDVADFFKYFHSNWLIAGEFCKGCGADTKLVHKFCFCQVVF